MKTWGRGLVNRMRQLWEMFVAMLREIFDESAYARFLARNGLTASREAYGMFLDEHGEAKARRPKCC
jgi:hypothetical protein